MVTDLSDGVFLEDSVVFFASPFLIVAETEDDEEASDGFNVIHAELYRKANSTRPVSDFLRPSLLDDSRQPSSGGRRRHRGGRRRSRGKGSGSSGGGRGDKRLIDLT
jgi:hypothetical protein